MKPIFLELFAGKGTLSLSARRVGFESVTVDIDPSTKPDICIDILNLRRSILPNKVAVAWASPPCTQWSLLQSHYHFSSLEIGYRTYYHEPRTPQAIKSLLILKATARIICSLNPHYYFIENPRAILRHRPEMCFVPYRKTVRYSDFGFPYEKPTDIFTNCKHFQPHTSRRPKGLALLTSEPDLLVRQSIPPQLADYIAHVSAAHLPSGYTLTPALF
ncbi:MAG: DNA cytosine methyltransferase [Betaproteobacteria bacterium]